MSKIYPNLPTALPTVTHTPKRSGSQAADEVKSGAEVGATPSTLLAPGTLTTHVPAVAGAPVDASKVEKLRAAVLDGSYTPNAAKIADRLVDLEKKLP
jgi:flagellar biosynthesis anti-sigma factor FlgM